MPANWADTPEKEKAWKRAKEIFKDQTDKGEDNWGESEWAQVMSIAKNIYNKKENIMRKIEKRKQEASFINRGGTFKQVDNEGRVWEEIEFDGMPYMVTSIDTTHFNMIPKSSFVNGKIKGRPATYHVSEFRYMPEFYNSLRAWLKGSEMIGGKSFNESAEKEKDTNIIEIKEETQIGDIILEKGDKIEVLKESTSVELDQNSILLIMESLLEFPNTGKFKRNYTMEEVNFVYQKMADALRNV